jgi:hypothetical protein
MRNYKVTTQPIDTVPYLVEVYKMGLYTLGVRLFNTINKRSQVKYIPYGSIKIDANFRHPRAGKLRKVYIKQSFVNVELGIYESF